MRRFFRRGIVLPMKDAPWQSRARSAGLTQKQIAALARRDENSVGRALAGERKNPNAAGPYIAIVLAWELMSPEQRAEWIRLAEEAAWTPT